MFKSYLIASLLLIPILTIGQQRDTVTIKQYQVLTESLPLVDAQAEIETILAKVNLEKDQVAQLKKLIKSYAKSSNKYRSQDSLNSQDYFALKEIETRHKFEVRKLLGEYKYRKLMVVITLE